jgi:hypothetical protein
MRLHTLIFVRQLAQVNIAGVYGPGNPGWNMAASAAWALTWPNAPQRFLPLNPELM